MAESAFYAGDIEGQIKELADQIGTINGNINNNILGKGTYSYRYICPGYISASGNYFSATLPIATTSDVTTFSIVSVTEISVYDSSSKTQYSGVTLSQVYNKNGCIVAEFKLPSTHPHTNVMCTIFFYTWSFRLS